jgi:hypothetical protein
MKKKSTILVIIVIIIKKEWIKGTNINFFFNPCKDPLKNFVKKGLNKISQLLPIHTQTYFWLPGII